MSDQNNNLVGPQSFQTSDKHDSTFLSEGLVSDSLCQSFNRDKSLSISNHMPKGSHHRSSPSPPHITKLNPTQPGNRWVLNLGCTTWVGVIRRIVGGWRTGNHSPWWKKVPTHLRVFPAHTPPHHATSFLERWLFLSLSSCTLWGRTEEPDTIWSKTRPPRQA